MEPRGGSGLPSRFVQNRFGAPPPPRESLPVQFLLTKRTDEGLVKGLVVSEGGGRRIWGLDQ